MKVLNLPSYPFDVRMRDGKEYLFDPVRKKEVRLTPEEWVRQHFIRYLHHHLGYPLTWMQVEKEFSWNGFSLRSDILVLTREAVPAMIVECKAPEVQLTDEVFAQIARYNLPYQVPFLVVTNGMVHYCCRMDYEKGSYRFLDAIPYYEELGVSS